jgi:plasmid stability protein
MSDLLIRKITPRMKRELQARARAHGRSLSEETKLVIDQGLRAPEPQFNMGDWLFNLVRPEDRGDDLVFEYRDDFPKPADFE